MDFLTDWMFLFLTFSFVSLLYLYFKRSHNYWKSKGIIYEPPSMLFGNFKDAVLLRRSPGDIMADIYRKHKNEKVVGIYTFNIPSLLIRDPDLVHRIMVSDFQNFMDNEIFIRDDADPVFGKNVFVLKGQRWKRERQRIRPAFTMSKLKSVFPQVVSIADEMVRHIEEQSGDLLIKDVFSRYTSEVVTHLGLGMQGHAFTQENPPFHSMGKLIFNPSIWNAVKQYLLITVPFLGNFLRISFIPKKAADFALQAINDVIDMRKRENVVRNDVIQYFIELQKKSESVDKNLINSDVIKNKLTEDDILVGFMTLFFDGYETTSLALTHTILELAKNQEIQDNLRKETLKALEDINNDLSMEDLSKLTYLNNVIYENLRMHPPLMHFGKVCTENTEIDIGKEEPYVVKKGTIIHIPIHGIHNDPNFWENPEKFNPERFTDEERSLRRRGTFMPFGDGPRICLGMIIAQLMLRVALVKLVTKFKIIATDRTPQHFEQDPTNFLRYHKDKIYVKFEKLKNED